MRGHARLPNPADPHLSTLFDLVDPGKRGRQASPRRALVARGADAGHARTVILECVATGLVEYDLSRPFDDEASLTRLFEGCWSHYDNRRVLAALIDASKPRRAGNY